MEKILITGGAGFIGSHIAWTLVAKGYEVHILDNLSSGKRSNVPKKAILHEMDVRDSESVFKLFAEYRFPIMFHQAAQMSVVRSVRDPRNDADVNILGLLTLLEAGKKNGLEKVVFASSGGVIYGDPVRLPQDEDHPLRPKSPYGIAKLACENYLRCYSETHHLGYVSLRYSNVYGPRQNPESGAGVIAIFMKKLLTGKQPVINGDGRKTRDFVYIADVVSANLHALSHHEIGEFNVGTGTETDINTVFQTIRKICGPDVPEIHGEDMAGEQERSCLDIKRARAVLDWTPKVQFEDGLRRTIAWYIKQNHQAYAPSPIMDGLPATG